jgi:hypothetical protein
MGKREGPGSGGKWLRRLASAPGRRTRVTRARAADRRDQATTGPGGQRRGEGRARQRDAALTRDPVA